MISSNNNNNNIKMMNLMKTLMRKSKIFLFLWTRKRLNRRLIIIFNK
jgi:hypothetical protein